MELLYIHIAAACAWVGLLACETVMELTAKTTDELRLVARIHKWIDLLFEGPLVMTVLVTGALLLTRSWPPSPLLTVKIVAALIGIAANLICIPLVLARAEARSDDSSVTLTRRIALTGYAIPFVLIALILGLIGV